MNRKLKKALSEWLEAEFEADLRAKEQGAAKRPEARAEDALGRAFRLIPVPSPSRAFVARTLRRAGLGGRFSSDLSAGWIRAAVASSLVLAAVALILIPGFLVPILTIGMATKPISLAIGFLAALLQRLAHGLAAWDVLSRMGSAAAETVASPAALGGMSVALLISFFAFRWLDQIVAAERSSSHA